MELSGSDFGGTEHPQIFIAWIGDRARSYAVDLVHELRNSGIRAELDTRERNLKGQMKYANKLGADYTVVIGDDEVSTGDLTLKNMKNSEQTKVRRGDLKNVI